ncbi:transposon Ty3-I Gag-Pol polyprotein [Trichonephila clavipes]|nr:transposon Ty3-I Gag-Pol polyprotein [Trichonephila clavipes]
MRSLAGGNVGEPLLKSLWLGRLPNGTQTILAALNEKLDKLATVADKINDLTFPQGINLVTAISKEKNCAIRTKIAQLTEQLNELTSFVQRSRSPARNSNHFRNRIKSRNRFKRSGYISVIPKSFAPHAQVQQELTLYAANGTKIPTYGTKRILLDLGLRHQFTWSFVIADVLQPIIGVDFLKHFNLLDDAKHHRVIDANTKLSSNGQIPKIKHVASNLAILVGNTKLDKVLKQYPELINPSQPINVDTSNQVYHHIETKGRQYFQNLIASHLQF